MKISLIVALSANRVIGEGNKLPWHLPEDLKRFKRITSGHPVIMGRKTYESIGRLLPGRMNIIITRNENYRIEGAVVVHSLVAAYEAAGAAPGGEEIFVIGGGEIFSMALPQADKLYLTWVKKRIEGDTFFPEIDVKYFGESFREEHPEFTFVDLERLPADSTNV